MKIIELVSTNVKRLRAVTVVPDGAVVQITGRNGQGKSSVLDSIFYALAGKRAMPRRPVRTGEELAVIQLDLGDVRVIRRIGADGSTSVVVEAANGARFPSPQKMLDDLLGELTFDPLKFSLAEPKQQLETLRSLVKLDVDIDALDRANEKDYVLRADWNRRAKSMAERVSTLREGVTDDDVTLIDISAMTKQLTDAAEHNAEIERAEADRQAKKARVTQLRQNVNDIREQIDRLQRQLGRVEQELNLAVTAVDEWIAPGQLIDVREIRAQIDEAMKANSNREHQHRQRAQLTIATQDLEEAVATSKAIAGAMSARMDQKAAAIGAANMPIDGLSFGDGMVIYNGVPLEQASSAEQLRVSFAIAMALNPKLRVVLIRDGSLLDADNLALIEKMAEEHDFQVFLERVDSSGNVGILIEDGEVRAIDGVGVERTVSESTAAD